MLYPVVNNGCSWAYILEKEGCIPSKPEWLDYYVDLILGLCSDPQQLKKCIENEDGGFLEDLEYTLIEIGFPVLQ